MPAQQRTLSDRTYTSSFYDESDNDAPSSPEREPLTSRRTKALGSQEKYYSEKCLTSPGNQSQIPTRPGWRMVFDWSLYRFLPSAAIAWWCTQSYFLVLVTMGILPIWAILQGSWAIFKYRVRFGDSPAPIAPSHGVVRVVSHPDSRPISENDTPLRLLVIGDSLAVGVGQSQRPTPIMPESIAKQISKALDGRPVMWTCRGAPGASAGWIVRELEHRRSQVPSAAQADTQEEAAVIQQSSMPKTSNKKPGSRSSGSSETASESSSSDEDSDSDSSTDREDEQDRASHNGNWKVRLEQNGIRLDGHRTNETPFEDGPYDIAIVLTGSNDLKAAFFPFLLQGEDAEFRRQAQQHGGGYGTELRRIITSLNSVMKRQVLDNIRESVSRVSERVRAFSTEIKNNGGPLSFPSSSALMDRDVASQSTYQCLPHDGVVASATSPPAALFPLVVLPGMPSRALPIFSVAPLRWLAIPIVDIMDWHKRKMARLHPEDVLFVNPPRACDMVDFNNERGAYWEDHSEEHTILNLRNASRRTEQRKARSMKSYMKAKRSSVPASFSHEHHCMFALDGVHPNDDGYEFWARHIGAAIVQAYRRKQQQQSDNMC